MRRLLVAAALLALAAPAAVGADTYRLDIYDSDNQLRTDFGRGEKIIFQVTVGETEAVTLDHKLYIYEGPDASGSNIWVVDDGGTTRTSPYKPTVLRIHWDQLADGVQVPPGTYTGQYRAPDRVLTATFTIEIRPDFRVTYLRALAAEGGALSPQRTVVGCVLNEGVREVDRVGVALSSRSALSATWFPQLMLSVGMHPGDDHCPWVPDGGTAFQIPFNAALAPGGAALRAVRAEANFDRAHRETDLGDNALEAPAAWLV